MSMGAQTLFEVASTPLATLPAGFQPRTTYPGNTATAYLFPLDTTQGQTQDPRTRVIHIHGTPAPQGSKKAFAIKKGGKYTGKVALAESSKAVKPWRAAVVEAAAGQATIVGPVAVAITFYLERPKGHYGTGRNAGTVKPAAPALPGVKPDVDKLVRSTLDGLTSAGVYVDDARVTDLVVAKRYADGRAPGATVRVSAACRPS